MNRNDFMVTLKKSLNGLSPKEIREILYDYNEHFSSAIEAGKTENQVVVELGDPYYIAKLYKVDSLINEASFENTGKNILKAIFAVIGLGFFNVVFVLVPFVAILSLIISLFVVSFGLVAGGGALFLISIFSNFISIPIFIEDNNAAFAFLGIGILCMGLISFLLNLLISKLFYFMTIKYPKWNLDFVQRRV